MMACLNRSNQRESARRTGLARRFRRGTTMVLLALLLPIVVIISAMVINLAYMELTRTELYIASDAAARAGGREFALTGDVAMARTKARSAANLNPVGGTPLQLADSDMIFGESTRPSLASRYNFTAGGSKPNALEITARRTSGSLNGPIPMLMPALFNVSSYQMQQTARSTQAEVDVAVVIDRSGSMAFAANEISTSGYPPASAPIGWNFGDHVPPNARWLDAVNAVNGFITELNTSPGVELTALCSYNDTATIDTGLTTNYSLFPAAMDVYTQSYNQGRTNIGGGIVAGINALASPAQRSWASKVILVMTDGIHNTGYDPVSAAYDARAQGIMVYTVTFSDEADQAQMQAVADAGFGKHSHASSGAALTTVFRDIAKALPTLLTK